MNEDLVVPIVAIVCIFVLSPLVIAYARVIWKRASEPPRHREIDSEQIQYRLEHLQQSVEAMAVEVERIAEGQRFVTKLMSEKERQPLGAGAATRNT